MGELYNFRYGDGNNNPSNGGKYDVYGANGIIGGYDKFNSENSIIIGHMGEYAGSVLWGEGKHFVTYNGTITRPKRNNIDDKFGYYMLYRKELNKICGGSGLPFLSYQELNKVEVDYSKNKDEQIKISKLLTDLDNLITLHQRKFNDIIVYKLSTKFLFLKLAKNVWEQRKLEDIGDNFSTGTLGYADLSEDGKYKCVLYGDLYTKFNERIFNVKSRTNTEATKVEINDILFPTSTTVDNISLIAPSCVNQANIRVGGDLFGIRPYKNIDGNFISYCINNFSPIKYSFAKQAQGLTIVHLQYNAVKNEILMVPSIDEQKRMSQLFIEIDNLITLHHRKYTYIFYSWEQRKLDRLLEQYTEVTTINNQYPALTSSRKGIFFQTEYFAGNQIASQNNVGYNIVPRNYFTYRHMSDDEIFHFNINDICDFGIVSTLYPVFTTKKELDSKYLQYQLNYGKEFAKFASLQKQGGSRTYMYFAKLKELVLTMPKVEEQTKISSILSNIDNLITLHQHKELKRRNDNNEHLRW